MMIGNLLRTLRLLLLFVLYRRQNCLAFQQPLGSRSTTTSAATIWRRSPSPQQQPPSQQQQLLQNTNQHNHRFVSLVLVSNSATPSIDGSFLSSDSSSNNNDNDSSSTSSSNSIRGTGTASITNEVFNLVKAIVGAGVLSLPYGIATYGNAPTAIIPAIVLITIFGIMSGYGFALIGRVCSITNTTSYKSAWESSISPITSWIPAVAVTCKTICATLAYSMILGDTFYSLLLSTGITTQISKSVVLMIVTSGILLPLCSLKNLSSLAPFSLVGSLGMVYTTIAMLIRYMGPTYKVPTGTFLSDIPLTLQPKFGTVGAMGVFTPVTSILLGMLSTSYMAHFNAPKFFVELQNNTIPRYMKVVAASFGISIAIFALISSIGFLTFGSNASGLILNNYSTKDVLMSFSRIAVAVSLVGSYPLAFVGARDGLMDVLAIKNKTSSKVLNTITVSLLSAITAAALIIPDVSFVLAFAGATLGNALIYIFPGLMFRGAIQKCVTKPTRQQKVEVKIAMTSAVLGAFLGLLGSIQAIRSIL